MTSFKSRLINTLMRNRHLLQGRLRREVFDMNTSIDAFRDLCEKGAAKYARIPEGISIRAQVIEGMTSEWLIPDHAPADKLVLYVHGGGYVSGSCRDHRGFVSKFAKRAGITNLIYEYRLAPEHPFPAALDDSVKIYRWILSSGYRPEHVLFAGESAGGGLLLALLLALQEQGLALPAAAVSISPWTDLTCSSDSYRTKHGVSVAPMNSWKVFSAHYVGTSRADEPLISPLFGDLKGLPPLLINSGEDDELFEDGERFARKAGAAGVDVTFGKGTGQVHCYPLLAPMFPEATAAMNEIVDFTRFHLAEH